MKPVVKEFFKSFTIIDVLILGASVFAIVLSFILCKSRDYLQLSAALVGAVSLILIAKGNVLGQFLSVIFSVFYGIISFYFHYYGEMITYVGMTAPMAIAVIVAWLRHPFRGNRNEVEIGTPSLRVYLIVLCASGLVSIAFYYILRALNTANLIWSTVSVLTSCIAALLSARRSPHYALAYACNDIVLIVLWSLAAAENTEYVTMIVCFSVFLLNDLYGFANWLRLRKKQKRLTEADNNAEAKDKPIIK